LKKLTYFLLALFLLLITLTVTGKKSVHHEIDIQAPPEKVWSIIIDTENYDNWNPVMRLIEGEVKEGNKVKYRFTQDEENISEIPSRVKKIIPNELLNQAGGIPFILSFNHKYQLRKSSQGTKLTIHEDYKGIGVNFWNPEKVQLAYQKLNNAIKKKAEE